VKGVINIGFIVAVGIFLSTIAFILLTVSTRFPLLQEQNELDNTISESYTISDRLIYDQGTSGWELDPSGAERIGLSSGKRQFLSNAKVTALNDFCNSPSNRAGNILKLHDIFSEKSVKIVIMDTNGLEMLRCEGSKSLGSSEFTAKRTAILEPDTIVNLEVTVSG
jgi:hypothetical protein